MESGPGPADPPELALSRRSLLAGAGALTIAFALPEWAFAQSSNFSEPLAVSCVVRNGRAPRVQSVTLRALDGDGTGLVMAEFEEARIIMDRAGLRTAISDARAGRSALAPQGPPPPDFEESPFPPLTVAVQQRGHDLFFEAPNGFSVVMSAERATELIEAGL